MHYSFISLILLCWLCSALAVSIPQKKKHACESIIASDGTKYDLTKLIGVTASHLGSYPFCPSCPGYLSLYKFSVCTNVKKPCHNYSCKHEYGACLVTPDRNSCIGKYSDEEIFGLNDGKGVMFLYGGGDLETRQAKLTINCDPKAEDFSFYFIQDDGCYGNCQNFTYFMEAASKHACKVN